ncbi:MAG: aminotransferase class III-fold pyridoxal phosphate-dependent enzyme, partial [Acidobacteria bacterium]|nr:aminotransferase class III-fold pyridoxal phosphate-dependent enzyme [Acidobacteriota bacterium]
MTTNTTDLRSARLPILRTALPGPLSSAIIERDQQYVSPSYTRSYPFVMQRGAGMMVEDPDGNIFLDLMAGVAVCSTGHSHPVVIEAIREQIEQFLHVCAADFYYPQLPELAATLARITPGSFPKRVHFGNSGAEAIEGGIKVAFHATGRSKLIGFYGSFHGRTMGALSVTASKAKQRAGFGRQALDVTHVPYANCYRCPYNLKPETCGAFESKGPHCARVIEEVILSTTVPPEECAAIVVEPIQGEGGYIVPPASFLQTLRAIADRHGILVIADEVQSGMGRTGRMYASEHFGLVPDVLATAKGIASGMPLSATVARSELMNWTPGAHASTFGGNPVAIAAALATIGLIEAELVANAENLGNYLIEGYFQYVGKLAALLIVSGAIYVVIQRRYDLLLL